MPSTSYRRPRSAGPEDLEGWVVDLVRVGATGNADGVRQLANRMVRSQPDGVSDAGHFRESVGRALADAASKTDRAATPLRRASPSELPVDKDSELPLAQLDRTQSIQDPVLLPDHRRLIAEILHERRKLDALNAAGLEPCRSLLLTGPPGVGKTLTARFIARELDLPLLTIDLASVMSSFLGRTGQNLRSALDFGRTREAVVFIDEFDALAKRRDDDSDIGELKRLVNVLLLELERWPVDSFLVAATNHPQLLDAAVERRFDRIIHIPLPDEPTRRLIFESAWPLAPVGKGLAEVVARALDGASGATVEAVARTAAKRVVLDDVEPALAVAMELGNRGVTTGSGRDVMIRALHDSLHLSNREIARLVGVSHPTVGAALERTKERSNAQR